MTKTEELRYMQEPEGWSRRSFLPLKNPKKLEANVSDDSAFGCLVAMSGKAKAIVHPMTEIALPGSPAHPFSRVFGPAAGDSEKSLRFQSFEELYEAGWRVD